MKIIDIETCLSHTNLWCVAEVTYETKEARIFLPDAWMPSSGNMSLKDGRDVEVLPLSSFVVTDEDYVAHYGASFDFPKLSELADIDIPQDQWIDTHIMSKMLNPNRAGGHSLSNL